MTTQTIIQLTRDEAEENVGYLTDDIKEVEGFMAAGNDVMALNVITAIARSINAIAVYPEFDALLAPHVIALSKLTLKIIRKNK